MTSLQETPQGRTAVDFATTNGISIDLEQREEGFSYNSNTRTLFLGGVLTREEQEGYFILAMTVLSQPELNAAHLSYDDYVAERINRLALGWENAIEHHGQRQVQREALLQEYEQAGRIPPEALHTPRPPLPLQNEYEQAYHEGVNLARGGPSLASRFSMMSFKKARPLGLLYGPLQNVDSHKAKQTIQHCQRSARMPKSRREEQPHENT